MPRTSIKQNCQKGFTLVEVAVVAPMMILVVLALLAMLIALVNGISIPTKQNTLVSSGEKTFDSIGSDIMNSSSLLSSVPAGFSDPNSSDYASPPANTDVLFVQGYNQTKDTTDTTGTQTQPAFLGTPPCSSATSTSSDNISPIVVVYFVKSGTLWRRVLTPTAPGATCASPLLIQQTCPPAPSCTNEDTPLVKNTVTEFTLTYYASDSSDTIAADKTTAKSVLVSIKSQTVVSNTTATQSSNIRVSRINN